MGENMCGKIRLEEDGKTVLIEDLQIHDENLYAFLKDVEEDRRIDLLKSALRIGVIGLKRMAAGGELDYVQKEFNSLLAKFEKMFDPEVKTSHFGKLSSLLEEYFDSGGTVENLFDPQNDDSPLGKLRKELHEEFNELRDMISKREEEKELIEKTTLKGYEFEDACEEILSEFVSKHIGDELEKTTIETGELTGRKAGDFLITLRDSNKKIVIETKNRDNITKPDIIENLEDAMKNRGADYGIFVSKYKEALPKNIGWFNEFKGNMLICALGSKEADTYFPELLNIAYQWAKLRITNEITIEEKALEVLTEGVREIESKLNVFSQIKTKCTNIEKAAKDIKTLSDELKEDIKEQINEIKKAIRTVSEESNNETYTRQNTLDI